MNRLLLLLVTLFPLLGSVFAQGLPAEIRIGVLAFGTLAWELAAIENEDSASAAGVKIVATTLASPEAAKIALQGGTVDMIVADWIWVARQREQGTDFTFLPYSTSHGALVVPADSSVRAVPDLKGKKLGVAGGGIDKNWLLLQALAKQKYGFDVSKSAEIAFGAPPLLTEQLQQRRLDALLNYWHYAAKLEAQGYRVVLDGRSMLRELGIDENLANLGYVFRESWAERHGSALRAFLDLATKAKNTLCEDDDAWRKIGPLTRETDPQATDLLRRRYCEGRIKQGGTAQVQAAEQVFQLLREAEGEELTGKSGHLPSGVFWQGSR